MMTPEFPSLPAKRKWIPFAGILMIVISLAGLHLARNETKPGSTSSSLRTKGEHRADTKTTRNPPSESVSIREAHAPPGQYSGDSSPAARHNGPTPQLSQYRKQTPSEPSRGRFQRSAENPVFLARPAAMPLAYLVDETQVTTQYPHTPPSTLEQIKDTFEKDLGAGIIDPTSPEYQRRWPGAASDSGDLLRARYGWAAYAAMQQKAAMGQ